MSRARQVLIACVLVGSIAAAAESDRKDAIARGLRYMEQAAIDWIETRDCASCHHAPMMVWTAYEAQAMGYPIDSDAVDKVRAFLLDENDPAKIFPTADPPPDRNGTQLVTTYVLLALAAGPPDWADSMIAVKTRDHFAESQLPDGNWPPFPSTGRAPIQEGYDVSARMVALALGSLPNLADDPVASAVVTKAYGALESAPEEASFQVQLLQMLVDIQRKASPEVVKKQASAIFRQQRRDGSWAQTADREGDAYMTGMALYALGKAGFKDTNPGIKHAFDFLLPTQREDGSWPMVSRPVEEGGEGAQLLDPIEAAATAWALLGMLAVESDGSVLVNQRYPQ